MSYRVVVSDVGDDFEPELVLFAELGVAKWRAEEVIAGLIEDGAEAAATVRVIDENGLCHWHNSVASRQVATKLLGDSFYC